MFFSDKEISYLSTCIIGLLILILSVKGIKWLHLYRLQIVRKQYLESARIKRRKRYCEIAEQKLKLSHIKTIGELQESMPSIRTLVSRYEFMGLDGEWTYRNNMRGPVSLLQIGFVSGDCFLLALKNIVLSTVSSSETRENPDLRALAGNLPNDFLYILNNKGYLKFGVGIDHDVRFLLADYGIQVHGFVDLRSTAFLLREHQLPKLGLKVFAKHWLGIDYDNESLNDARMSDWEKDALKLTTQQMTYAAYDALTGALCCLEFYYRKQEEQYVDLCDDLETNFPRILIDSIVSDIESVIDRRFKFKSYSNRKMKCLYSENAVLLGPNNEFLSSINAKKAHWYLQKGMADLLSGKGGGTMTIRMKGQITEQKSTSGSCIVCGTNDLLYKRHLIPFSYRRFISPSILEAHEEFLLCHSCHQSCSQSDATFLRILKEDFAAFDCSISSERFQQFKKVKSAAKALLISADRLPEARKLILETEVKEFLQIDALTVDILQSITSETILAPPDFEKALVSHIIKERGIMEFIKRWKKHFIQFMRPQYLPSDWISN